MKGEWFLPIRLKPDNGLLLRIYLVGLHLGCGALLYGVVPITLFAVFGIALTVLMGHNLQGIVSFRQVNSLSIQPRHQVILTDYRQVSESVRLRSFRQIAGLVFLRVVRSGRIISICCRRGDQDSTQWHRLMLMQRYDMYPDERSN